MRMRKYSQALVHEKYHFRTLQFERSKGGNILEQRGQLSTNRSIAI